MICLSVRFDDKIKSKSLEVDFLIVNVPTAHNVIIGRPTLYRSTAPYNQNKAENETNINKTERRGLHIGDLHHPYDPLPPKHRLQLLGGWWPRPRGDKLDLLRIAALRGGPFTLIHKVEIGLVILVNLEHAGKGQHDLAEIPEGVGAALLVACTLAWTTSAAAFSS
ncbi:hypothetical protein Cgig2_008536 [Carnegiea gigantea]|uniref:Uncharacterized protein n=1 Tax=Carnegiea gigantea TaxID=171969 RepID=A0A9Q1Q8G5_9CARY|nr:hypothetical protein Cgig2_008536 [Carnegiea gigantea]